VARAQQLLARETTLVVSGTAILGLGALALAAPFIFPSDPNDISIALLRPPLSDHFLGTDELGRSVAVALLYGLRVSLLVGVTAAGAALVAGVAVGSIAGYFGRWVDTLTMRVTEVFQVMPSFILAALVVALLGGGLARVIAVIAVLSWPDIARVTRAEVLRVKELDFVDAARALALPESSIVLREVVPNALGPALSLAPVMVGRAILLEASLGFFGLTSPTLVSWGRMLNSGQQYLFQAWWLSVFPGLAIFVTVLFFNLFGDAFSRVINPRRSSE
jgi:peptide/nickel transport system permease protein